MQLDYVHTHRVLKVNHAVKYVKYFTFGIGIGPLHASWTCLLVIIIYLMDFFYFQRDLESRPCREILYKGARVLCVRCFVPIYVNPL